MSKKEEFLKINTYEEYDQRREEFSELLDEEPTDEEVLSHLSSFFPEVDNSDWENGIIVELYKHPPNKNKKQ